MLGEDFEQIGKTMAQGHDLKYFLVLDGDEIFVEEHLTIGRHLDNDVMVPGEDVLDYHLRLEPTSRGITAHPLGEATLTVNDHHYSEARGLIEGDELTIGHHGW